MDKTLHTYKNPWHRPRDAIYGPAMYQTDATPIEHAGCQLFERIDGPPGRAVWDVVKDGICRMQRAGCRGAKEGAEDVARQDAEKKQMVDAGFEWDPARGYTRWTHRRTGVTALRQPYMTDDQWTAHQLEKIAQVQARS